MNTTRWVRHFSGHGKKYELHHQVAANVDMTHPYWVVLPHGTLVLPKVEYVICDPPDVWVDVTNDCFIGGPLDILHNSDTGPVRIHQYDRYRVRIDRVLLDGGPCARCVLVVEMRVVK